MLQTLTLVNFVWLLLFIKEYWEKERNKPRRNFCFGQIQQLGNFHLSLPWLNYTETCFTKCLLLYSLFIMHDKNSTFMNSKSDAYYAIFVKNSFLCHCIQTFSLLTWHMEVGGTCKDTLMLESWNFPEHLLICCFLLWGYDVAGSQLFVQFRTLPVSSLSIE